MNPVAPRALTLLIRSLDAADSRIIADDLDPGERDAFDVLRDCGALKLGPDVPAVLCPWCGEHDVAPVRRAGGLQALCPDCGYVNIKNAALQAWALDPGWLLGRLRGAFGIAARQASTALVPDLIWAVGTYTKGKREHRILFARRLADHAVQQALRAVLHEVIPKESAVLIGTTSRSAARLEDLALPYVHLAEIVHWRKGDLKLDEERWEWCLQPAHRRRHDASPTFSDQYRRAVIDGEEYAFTPNQAQVFTHLHAARGEKCLKDSIMATVGSPQKNPAELFRHNARQYAAFQQLVESDDHGFYWLKRL